MEEISRVGAGSGALKCSAPELKGDEYKRARAEGTWDCVDLKMMRSCSEISLLHLNDGSKERRLCGDVIKVMPSTDVCYRS